MKINLMIFLLIMLTIQVSAQKEYKIAKSEGKLILNNISNFSVEGYNGNQIIFEVENRGKGTPPYSKTEESGDDPRAKGLSELNNNGFDNTGMKLNISEEGKNTMVSPVGNLDGAHLSIKLPNTVSLSVRNGGWPVVMSDSNTLYLSHIKSEIEISGQFENCKLYDITGPLSIKTLSGNVEVVLGDKFKGPVSIQTISGFIDLTVPEGAKANLIMSSIGGTLYADKKLKLESKAAEKRFSAGSLVVDSLSIGNGWVTVNGAKSGDSNWTSKDSKRRVAVGYYTLPYSGGGSSFNGTLNGGGQKIDIRSMSGKIYLRR